MEEADDFAMRSFFYDFCIISENHCLSRGFLGNLEAMLRRHSLDSDLSKACRAVAYASRGTTLKRPPLVQRGRDYHDQVLSHFPKHVADPTRAYSTETLAISMLLGLFEV